MGENIYPKEIEDVLSGDATVDEAAVHYAHSTPPDLPTERIDLHIP